MQGARELGLALPQTAGALQLMRVCAANDITGLDHSALVKALALTDKHELPRAISLPLLTTISSIAS